MRVDISRPLDVDSLFPEHSLALSHGWETIQKSNNNIPILSFFTGAGFLDLGFELEGFRSIWHNETNPWFVRAFEEGMSAVLGRVMRIENTHSIVDIGPNQILREAFGKTKTPPIFGVIGGPPCPDFSIGGKNRGRHGDHGKLSQVYVDRICELRPTFFLFENVKGLFRTARHRTFLDQLLCQLEANDFLVDLKVLNAIDFGVPQDRERVFIFGISRKWLRRTGRQIPEMKRKWFQWPVDARYYGAKDKFEWPTVTPIGIIPAKPVDIPDVLTVWSAIGDVDDLGSKANAREGFKAYSPKFQRIEEGDTSRKSFKRLHRWRFSPTAAYGNNEVHLHPFLPRRLTVRESLRIQSVPDGYVLPEDMPLSAKFKTIGNGVPVKLAKAMALAISTCLGARDETI